MRYPEFDGTQACAEVGMEFFFPAFRYGSSSDYTKARSICNRCEWQVECGEWALHHDSGFGMWGGWTPRERRMIRQQRGIINDPPEMPALGGAA